MGTEQRTTRRVPIVVQVEAQAGGFPFIAISENISAGGMLIKTVRTMPEGSIVHLKFTLPDTQQQIRVNATVQHVTPGSYLGTCFDDLDPNDCGAVERFVDAV